MNRLRFLASAVVVVVAIAGCEEPVGDVVTCTQQWTCDGTVVADNVDEFCTDPADEQQRTDDIAAYEAEFNDGCDGVNVNCVDGTLAECAATCVVGGECNLAEQNVRVRLD